jgi:methyl-accepting chemotaxis protein
MKVGTKLVSAFVVVSAITAIVGMIGIQNMGKINDMVDTMYLKELLGTSYIKEANVNLLYMARAEKNFLLSSTQEQRDLNLTNMNRFLNMYKEQLEKAKPLF